MISIPEDVLAKIEEQRPDLAAAIQDLLSTEAPSVATYLERRIALAYLTGDSELSAEETLSLAACCNGRPYGEMDRSHLH